MAREQTLLESLMRKRHWSQEQLLAELERTARAMSARDYTLSRRQLARWLSGEVTVPRGIACQVAERLFGHPIERLLAPKVVSAADSLRDIEDVGGSLDLAEQVGAAAGISRDHAASAATGYADDASLEQLRAEVRRLAHAYAHKPPLTMHTALVRTRDLAYRLMERTHRPVQLCELYLVAGEACGLLSSTAFDLGYAEAAEDHARAAYTYGQVIGHDRLRAWARSVQATVAFWAGRPHESLDYVLAALDYAKGAQAARLHAIASRAWSMLGAGEQADLALRHAFSVRDTDMRSDELTEIGGEFAFGPARLALCAGAVHVALGDGQRAARYASEALQLYQEAPVDQQRFAMHYGAWIDLATARALQGHLEGAETAMQPALSLDPKRRTARLTQRMQSLRAVVNRKPHQESVLARHISQAVADFTADTPPSATRCLPPGS